MTQAALALALSAITFMVTVIWGTPFMRVLRRFNITIPSEADPDTPPSMGGLLVMVPVAMLGLVLNFANIAGLTGVGSSVLLPILTLVGFSLLGLYVDIKLDHVRNRIILGVQLLMAVAIAYGLYAILDVPEMYLPFYKGEFEIGAGYILVAALVIMISANAMQATTDVQGLTGLLAATAYTAYGAIASVQGQHFIARICFTMIGALFGLLWFNIKPASLLLGRTGAYSIGATLAVVALMTGQWVLLLLITAVPLIELGSLSIERVYGLLNHGKAFFSTVPLHAQLQASGWSSTQVVQRYWLITLIFAMIGFTLALV